jgi:hypothetical protein
MPRTAFSPTLRMARKPKRMASPAGVKSMSLEFTSGGSTVMPAARASPMYFTILSALPVSEVSKAQKNSTGKCTLSQAVW